MDLVTYLDVQREWSEIVFGEGPRVEGVCKHIEKELKEVRANPTDVVEWIDIAILALDGAWRAGYSPQQVCDAMVAKQKVNLKRKWHTQISDDEPIVHVKEIEQWASKKVNVVRTVALRTGKVFARIVRVKDFRTNANQNRNQTIGTGGNERCPK